VTLILRGARFSERSLKALASPFIKGFEDVFFKAPSRNEHPPVFIVGAPRTGSTILYQALTNVYNLAYIDNTACSWHRNLRFGMWLSKKKYGEAPHHNFKADHGSTRAFGGHAPSECGAFWYRWLPAERHFVDYEDITRRMLQGIYAEIAGVSSYLGKSLVFKNLNAGQRLRLIKEVFPDARIIVVRRDPRFVIRSILRARKKVGVKEGQWWSIMPPNVEDLRSLPETEMCAAQVYFLEKQIEEDLALFPRQNVKIVHYRDFSPALIHELGHWIGARPRVNSVVPGFQQDRPERLSAEQRRQLDALAESHPFSKELFV